MQLGEPIGGVISEPGLHWRIPFIQDVLATRPVEVHSQVGLRIGVEVQRAQPPEHLVDAEPVRVQLAPVAEEEVQRREATRVARALDRVLLWNHYVVPQWNYPFQRTARWDRFGRPADDKMPKYGAAAFPTIWWWDAERAAKTGARG